MNASEFLSIASREEMLRKFEELAASADPKSIEELKAFLLVRDSNTFDKHVIPRLVCRALLSKGAVGARALGETVEDAPGSIYPASIIESLWYASLGELAPGFMMWPIPEGSILTVPPSADTAREAQYVFHDLVLQSHVKEELFNSLMQFLYQQNLAVNFEGNKTSGTFRSAVFDVFTESSIKISRRLIEDFEALVNQELREEEYQQFLAAHPVLIDPLAGDVIPKQKLGLEKITDYVVRRLDNEYILVEIEKPQNRIFTESGDFTAEFTHAFGQVIDFQEWVDTHAEYARHLMPSLSSPRGLLIIGRRVGFSKEQEAKLKRFCINSKSVEILTYDDVIQRARNLYENIFNRSHLV